MAASVKKAKKSTLTFYARKKYMDLARDLRYPADVITGIRFAESETEITNLLTCARNRVI